MQINKKVLFLHGFFASGSCVPATTLQETLGDKVTVLTPDLPLHPKEAMEYIRRLIDKEHPDLLVGNSCGSFYAQMLAPVVGIPALIGNPHFEMDKFVRERIGEHQYKSPRRDGNQTLIITEALADEFLELQQTQFDLCSLYYKDKVWGIFGESDTLAQYEPLFLQHYNQAFHFPGGHTPTAKEVTQFHVPLIKKMLLSYPKAADGYRYFRHFKGGMYRFIHTAYDSETQERKVVYQALYGDGDYWIRPERMFFEQVTRNGKTFERFSEVDKE